jgi:hypothetical protein
MFNPFDKDEIITHAWDMSQKIDSSSNKTNFAFDILTMKQLVIPAYIKESLHWLSINND